MLYSGGRLLGEISPLAAVLRRKVATAAINLILDLDEARPRVVQPQANVNKINANVGSGTFVGQLPAKDAHFTFRACDRVVVDTRDKHATIGGLGESDTKQNIPFAPPSLRSRKGDVEDAEFKISNHFELELLSAWHQGRAPNRFLVFVPPKATTGRTAHEGAPRVMSLGSQCLEDKRTTRWQVVREVEDKVERVRKSMEEDMHGAGGDGKPNEGKWFILYERNRGESWKKRLHKLDRQLEEQRKWRVKVWDREIKPIHAVKPPPMDMWRRNVWPRNFYCELCMGVAGPGADVLDCRTCNVVMHFRCVTSRFGGSQQQQLSAREWQCEFCRRTKDRDELEYQEAVRRAKERELHFRMSIRIQSHVRAWLTRTQYMQLMRRVAKTQALIRMFLQRSQFRAMLNSFIRIYKMKIVDITDMTPLEAGVPSATFTLVLSIINSKHRHDGSELRYIDPGQQRYRFETTTFHYNTHVRLNQQFLVPGSTNQVLLACTLIRREGVKNEFWGQAIVEAEPLLEKRNKVRLNLGELKFEPRDRKNIVPLKNRVLEERSITGYVTAEIVPLSNAFSKSSMVYEVPEIGKDGGMVRQWWACLVDQCLLLFKKYGDSLPYRSITILKVSWYNRTSIRVSSLRGDEAIVFTCSDPDMRSDWYFKLKATSERAMAAAEK